MVSKQTLSFTHKAAATIVQTSEIQLIKITTALKSVHNGEAINMQS